MVLRQQADIVGFVDFLDTLDSVGYQVTAGSQDREVERFMPSQMQLIRPQTLMTLLIITLSLVMRLLDWRRGIPLFWMFGRIYLIIQVHQEPIPGDLTLVAWQFWIRLMLDLPQTHQLDARCTGNASSLLVPLMYGDLLI